MDGLTDQQQPPKTSSGSPLPSLQWRQQPNVIRLDLLQTVLCQEQPLTPYQAMQVDQQPFTKLSPAALASGLRPWKLL